MEVFDKTNMIDEPDKEIFKLLKTAQSILNSDKKNQAEGLKSNIIAYAWCLETSLKKDDWKKGLQGVKNRPLNWGY